MTVRGSLENSKGKSFRQRELHVQKPWGGMKLDGFPG